MSPVHRLVLIVGTISLLAGASVASRDGQYVLDLARPSHQDPEERTSGGGSGCGIGSSGEQPLRLPITLTLEPTDRYEYLFADAIEFAVTIENQGKDSILLPWSSMAALPKDAAGVRHGALSLGTENAQRFDGFAGTMIEGAESVPASVLVLQPRATATIRTRASILVPEPEVAAFAPVAGRVLEVRGRLRLENTRCRWAAPVISTNSRAILVRGRK